MMATLAMLNDNRIVGLNGHLDDELTFTSIRDVAGVVAGAVEYEGEWPEVGGISGDRVSLRQIQQIGQSVMGKYMHYIIIHYTEHVFIALGVC